MIPSPRRRGTLLGALAGFVSLSVVAGLLTAVALAPGVVAASNATAATVDVFERLPAALEIGTLPQRNVLFADKGGKQVPVATIYDQNRVSVADDQVAQTIKDALVAGEDRRFFEHNGVDATSTLRAVAGVLTHHDRGGGSTLTMQLVRNILVAEAEAIEDPAERKKAYAEATKEEFGRKLAEMKYALGIEKKYTKQQILLAYLNISYFGDNTYGIEAAAQHYLGKSAQSVTPSEAASLIAMVQYPSSRNLSTPEHYKANQARRDVILAAMLETKKIDAATYKASIGTPIASYVHLTPSTQGCLNVADAGAGQWCDLVVRTVTTLPALGKTPGERKQNWKNGGYAIHTSLDLDLTATAKDQLVTYAPNTETRYDLGGVVVSIEAKTGRVIVMTQNKDFNNTRSGGGPTASSLNYAVDHDMGGSNGFQPGSTYKPFTLLDWLDKGHKLYDTVNAAPRDFSPNTICGSKSYVSFTPKNDNGGNPGRVSARQATTSSINTAFAAMAQQLDLCDIRDVAKSLGVHSANGEELHAYPSSTIGSGNTVSPLTMAAAFAGIANEGVFCTPTFVDSVVDSHGKSLPGQSKSCAQAVKPEVAAAAVSAMQTVFRQGTAVAANPGDGIPVMGKTGTTDNAEQTWLVGSTTNVATAAWVGNLTGHQNQYRIYGAHGAMNVQRLTIWKHVMQAVDAAYGGEAFAAPSPGELSAPAPVQPYGAEGRDEQEGASRQQSGAAGVGGQVGETGLDGGSADGGDQGGSESDRGE